jgi:uncharacterized membrane protein
VRFRKVAVAGLIAAGLTASGSPLSSSAAVAQTPPTFSLTDLGIATGYAWSAPRALSSDGAYVGLETLAQGKASMYERAALWHAGAFKVFGTLGGVNSEAQGINTAGVLVGSARDSSQMEQAFWTNGGTMSKLPGLGGAAAWAYGINDSNVVVGSADDSTGVARAVSWKSKKVARLGDLGGGTSQAFAVNAAGQAVGVAETPGGHYDPVLFKGGQAIDLLGSSAGSGVGGTAYAINNTGQIVGGSGSNCNTTCNQGPWLYSDGIIGSPELGLGGATGLATGINDHWQIVGASASAPAGYQTRGMLFSCGQDYDLTNLLDSAAAGWTVYNAVSITNDGTILAAAFPPGQTTNAHMVILHETDPGTCDTTPPTGSITLDSGAASTTQPTVSVHQDSSDDSPSGVLEWRLSDSATTDSSGKLVLGRSFAAPFNQYSPNPSENFDMTDPANGGTAATGTKTIYAQWRDWSGNWSTPISAPISYQPTVSVSVPQPLITQGAQLSKAIPITYSWSPSSPSTLNGYTAEQTTDGTTYTPVSLATATSSNIGVLVAPSSHDRLAVQGSFTPGGFSAWSSSPLFQPLLHQETWAALHPTGTWTQTSGTGFNGGGARQASQAGASEQFTFSGRGVAWVAQTAITNGTAQVYVDGTLAGTISLNGSNTNQQIVFSRGWNASASHTVKIVDQSGTIDIDAIITLK